MHRVINVANVGHNTEDSLQIDFDFDFYKLFEQFVAT